MGNLPLRLKSGPDIKTLLFWQAVLFICSFASYSLQNYSNSLLLYLTLAFAIVLVHWYGWKMLLVIYLNGLFTLFLWKAHGPMWRLLLIATHEPVVALGSKVLVDYLIKKRYEDFLSSTDSFVLFVLYGIAIPSTLNSIYVYHYSFINGDMEKVILYWLSDFITILAIAIPLLYFFRPSDKGGITLSKSLIPKFEKNTFFLLGIILLVYILLSFKIPFDKYWFIYGIGSVVVATRLGFGWVIIINVCIFILNYILPLVDAFSALLIQGSSQLTNVHLGSATMMFISLLVGRVVSDLRSTKQSLLQQKDKIEKANQQLKQANEELDRFVYSVSHDISAPLKSIQGLINISKMDSAAPIPYVDKLEKSVLKLEDFIAELLDYSRTNRKEIVKEKVSFSELYTEVLDKFTFLENFERIKFVKSFYADTAETDKFLLKVIMSNLLSNAIKYQKTYQEHQPVIEVKTHFENAQLYMEIIDNGMGIKPEVQEMMFTMFYRGTTYSTGSGLGLYIAQEAANRIGGLIHFSSEYGIGSKFRLELHHQQN